MLMARKQAWLTVLLVTVVAIFGGFMIKVAQQSKTELVLETATLYPQARALSSFEAADQHGRRFDNTQLHGKWSLIFFGYRSCPDICPTTLATLTSVQKNLPPEIQTVVQMIFVTVDPERDSPEKLNEYAGFFSSYLIALHLSEPVLAAFARDIGVAYVKVPQGDTYVMDHSVRIFLINPRGERHAIFSPTVGTQGFSVEKVASDLRAIMAH